MHLRARVTWGATSPLRTAKFVTLGWWEVAKRLHLDRVCAYNPPPVASMKLSSDTAPGLRNPPSPLRTRQFRFVLLLVSGLAVRYCEPQVAPALAVSVEVCGVEPQSHSAVSRWCRARHPQSVPTQPPAGLPRSLLGLGGKSNGRQSPLGAGPELGC